MEQDFERLFEQLPIGAVIVDRDHVMRSVNQAFAQFLGYSVEELEGMSMLDVTKSLEREELEAGIEQLFEGTRKHLELQTCYIRKDGENVWGYPVRMLHPNPASDEQDTMLMLVVDITRRRQLERQLRHTERMSAMGMLAGSIAHDFNNVLTVVSTFVSLIETQPSDSETIAEGIERIRKACQRGQDLTQQLLEFGRSESSTVEVIDLNEFIGDITRMFERILPPSIAIELHLSDSQPSVMTDEGRLHQILMNLVLNARDALKDQPSGTIVIETDSIDSAEADFPDADALDAGEYSRLRICDTGAGMAPDMISEIFDPFFTTKGEEGTGMGLTTVYGIVEEDKGYIRVDTTPGEGTCFEIFLPATEETRKESQPQDGGSRLTP